MDMNQWTWTNKPAVFDVQDNGMSMVTEPETDLWQRTYYGFQPDNAPVFQMRTQEKFFTFMVTVTWEAAAMYDQAGIAIYLDSDNWMKASVEYENEQVSRLGSVVTNHGYSDWATTDIPSDISKMVYRLSRRDSDYYIETSRDGIHFEQMRIFHLFEGGGAISFGVYACSPTESSFPVQFTDMKLMDCQWELHV